MKFENPETIWVKIFFAETILFRHFRSLVEADNAPMTNTIIFGSNIFVLAFLAGPEKFFAKVRSMKARARVVKVNSSN